MSLIVSLADSSVQAVESFGMVPGMRRNTQHWQLPGHVLVELDFSDPRNRVMRFYHPETDPVDTGHFDLALFLDHHQSLRRHDHRMPLCSWQLDRELQPLWPGGSSAFRSVLVALNGFLGLAPGADLCITAGFPQ